MAGPEAGVGRPLVVALRIVRGTGGLSWREAREKTKLEATLVRRVPLTLPSGKGIAFRSLDKAGLASLAKEFSE